jgi:hypothetical protein
MPVDLSKVMSRTRRIEDPDLGTIIVREPTLGDYLKVSTDRWWWVACLSCEDGTPLMEDPTDMGRIRAEVATRLMEAVNTAHPTAPPAGGSGESPVPSSD